MSDSIAISQRAACGVGLASRAGSPGAARFMGGTPAPCHPLPFVWENIMLDSTMIELSRWQFAGTALYHFLFVPLTLGL